MMQRNEQTQGPRGSVRALLLVGAILGAGAILLEHLGNPPSMGMCVGCFLRDVAGALGLHHTETGQYVRPEIAGLVLGALLAAVLRGEWRARGGPSPILQFLLGFFAMAGVLVFLGCPWRALLRTSAGDLNGLTGLAGLTTGVALSGWLRPAQSDTAPTAPMPRMAGLIFPAAMLLLLGLSLWWAQRAPGLAPFSSRTGPGSMRAPPWASLGVGLTVGLLAQRSRLCLIGAIREIITPRRPRRLFWGIVAMLAAATAGNLWRGAFHVGWRGMPVSHAVFGWNFAAMMLCGLAFAAGRGCPLRQLVRSAEGDGDAALFCTGMLVGAGICHNWTLIALPDKTVNGVFMPGGPTAPAQWTVLAGLVICMFVLRATRADGAAAATEPSP